MTPRIIHVFSTYSHRNIGDKKRHAEAASSWWRAYKNSHVEWVNVSVPETSLKRNAKTVLGDAKTLPFIRDVIDDGIEQAHGQPDDLIVWSNDDVCFTEDITNDIWWAACGWASRRDFMAVPRRITKDAVAKGRFHPGCDLAFFTVAQWADIRQKMPDMLLAREAFDLILMHVLAGFGGKEIKDVLAHSMHFQYWVSHSSDPSSMHNKSLAESYREANGIKKHW